MRDIDKQLFSAAKLGGVDDVVELLKGGANANATDFMGMTPLMAATLKDHVGCVEALLPSSDARAVDEDGCSALIYACQHMRLDCAKALLPVSDVDRKAADGRGAIDHATGWGDAELVGLIKSYQLAQSEARELSRLDASSVPGSASPRL
ncbi:MAG: ankyrin repeat domain-containing protein [Pseudomonadota bacterium]